MHTFVLKEQKNLETLYFFLYTILELKRLHKFRDYIKMVFDAFDNQIENPIIFI